MLANPDRLVGSDGLLEIKTTGAYTDAAKLWREGLVPPHAWVQAHWYAHVTGRSVLWFIAEVDRQPIVLGPYDADQDLMDDLDLEAREFWALVEGETHPVPEDEEVAAPVVIVDGLTKPLEPWDDTVTDLARLLDLKDQIKELTAEAKDLEASIQAEMGEAEFLTSTDGEVIYATNRVGSRSSLDQAAMKADGIDVDAYKVTKPNSKPTLNVKKEARA
jgi:predicted phage-related endonuclease